MLQGGSSSRRWVVSWTEIYTKKTNLALIVGKATSTSGTQQQLDVNLPASVEEKILSLVTAWHAQQGSTEDVGVETRTQQIAHLFVDTLVSEDTQEAVATENSTNASPEEEDQQKSDRLHAVRQSVLAALPGASVGIIDGLMNLWSDTQSKLVSPLKSILIMYLRSITGTLRLCRQGFFHVSLEKRGTAN